MWTDPNPLVVIGAFLIGIALGALYFWGLWLTVRWLPVARWPGLAAMGSFLGRLAILLLGLVLIARGGRWWALLAALIGVIVGRTLLVRRIGVGVGAEEEPAGAEGGLVGDAPDAERDAAGGPADSGSSAEGPRESGGARGHHS
jgi:F1F0 ATPase subunit 2